jgi:Protein of unknown function (DUF3540)
MSSLHQLSFIGRVARAEVEKVKVLAGSFDSIVERVSQTIQRSYRAVTDGRSGPRRAHRLRREEEHDPPRPQRARHGAAAGEGGR